MHWIIDGYNIQFAFEGRGAIRGGADLETRRHRFLRALARAAPEGRVTVVFDGQSARREPPTDMSGLSVVFAPAGTSADTLIAGVVARKAKREEVTVVSSDHVVRDSARASNCYTLAAEAFLSLMAEVTDNKSTHVPGVRGKDPGTMDAFFPPGL